MNVKMDLKGTIHVNGGDEYQCGYEGKDSYNWNVLLVGSEDQMNKHSGFLVEHYFINDYFESVRKMTSGEKFVTKALTDLKKICQRKGFEPKLIRVELFGSDKHSFVAEEGDLVEYSEAKKQHRAIAYHNS